MVEYELGSRVDNPIEAALVATGVGALGASITGGDVVWAALTAATVHLYNEGASVAQKGGLAISDAEREFARSGKRKEFWESRLKAGDKLAQTALNIVNDEGVLEKITNFRLRNYLKYSKSPLSENDVGVALMNAHVSAVDFDFNNNIGNIAGNLSYMQIDAHHYEVFDQLSISRIVYGGDLVPGFLSNAAYCSGCDSSGERIR